MDEKKLRNYINRYGAYPVMQQQVSTPEGLDPDDVEEISDELKDDASDASIFARKLAAGYMELGEKAGAFSCGNCKYLREGVCTQAIVRAPVSASNGCCDYFEPSNGDVVFPPSLDAE